MLQTLALDIGFIIEDILRAKGKLLRGLAHPAVFAVRPALLVGGHAQKTVRLLIALALL